MVCIVGEAVRAVRVVRAVVRAARKVAMWATVWKVPMVEVPMVEVSMVKVSMVGEAVVGASIFMGVEATTPTIVPVSLGEQNN